MSIQEYDQWLQDAFQCLLCRYNIGEAEIIVQWFCYMKGSDEIDLVGEVCVNLINESVTNNTEWNLYNSLMSRLWIYAPHILKREVSK